ncbi:MAG: hypothetical protein AAGC53_17590 [Actinomycetota bacterium]
MELDRRTSDSSGGGGLALPAKIAIGGLALFGAISVLQWIIAGALRFIQIGIVLVVVMALAGWVVSAKANR